LTVPKDAVPATPVTETVFGSLIITLPIDPVADTPLAVKLASADTVTLPRPVVPATPLTVTGEASPQVPLPQVDLPQPEIADIYAILIIADEASAVGKAIVKSPAVAVLSPPKSKTHTALSDCVSLYIKAPLAVIVTLLKVKSLKSQNAVVPDVVGVTLVSADPVAE
jgi:hypothetical protein